MNEQSFAKRFPLPSLSHPDHSETPHHLIAKNPGKRYSPPKLKLCSRTGREGDPPKIF
jgi:hypothetical protein